HRTRGPAADAAGGERAGRIRRTGDREGHRATLPARRLTPSRGVTMTADSGAPISTGQLPPPHHVLTLVDEAYREALEVTDGAVSTVYPALARVDPEQLGVSLVG